MSESYVKESKKLAEYYYPIEHNPIVSFEEKSNLMQEWWQKHMGELLIKSGLNLNLIKSIVAENKLELRENIVEFFDILKENEIPILIFSAGMGDIIVEYMKKIHEFNSNIHVIANFYSYDEFGKALSLKGEIIHSLNKDMHDVSKQDFFKQIKGRKNVILLGDSINDLKMSNGFDCENIFKIGFLNKNFSDENYVLMRKQFEENFDLILDGNSSFDDINALLNRIIMEN